MEATSEFFEMPSPANESAHPECIRIGGSAQGYCEVWRYDRAGRFRALKCLKEDYRGKPLYENLLRKEFEIGYSLDHRNICEYYSFIEDPVLGSCIEMEWVDGRTLETFLAEKKQDRQVCCKIAGELCDALSYMHAKQVLHKDLKPSNILVTYNGDNVKIIDFGMSDSDSSSVLKMPAGTLAYAAPEVRSGGKATVRSDLYSLGMVLSLFPVRRIGRVARRLCSARPEKRYSSAIEVGEALKAKGFVFQGLLFILLVALMALIPALEKVHSGSKIFGGSSDGIAVPADNATAASIDNTTAADTLAAVRPASSQDTGKKQPQASEKGGNSAATKKTDSSPASDQRAIDELFRQATELFE